MSQIRESIKVDRPVRTVYNQWTQFEEFPRFMDGVQEVRQISDKELYWNAEIGGVHRSWRAKIVEQVPDQVVAWTSTDGARNAGRVTFEPLGEDRTRVNLELDVEPEGFAEGVGDALGIIKRRAKDDLQRFCDYIEGREVATGAWRGRIHGGTVMGGDTNAPRTDPLS